MLVTEDHVHESNQHKVKLYKEAASHIRLVHFRELNHDPSSLVTMEALS